MTDLQHWFHGSSPLLTGQRDCVQSRQLVKKVFLTSSKREFNFEKVEFSVY